MATAAPTVTIAADSHKTPIRTHNGRGARTPAATGWLQDLQRRLGLAQRGGGAFDIGKVTGKLFAGRPLERAGLFDLGRRGGHRRRGATAAFPGPQSPRRRVRSGSSRGRMSFRQGAEILLGHRRTSVLADL